VQLPERWAMYLLWGVLAVLALLALRGSVYTVGTDEQGVILRLGRWGGIAEPGFHFKLPFGFDEVHLVPTKRVLKEEFGFRTVRADVRSEFAKQPYVQESLTLTGDLNIADVEWIVQYRISDPTAYWFQIEEPAQTVRDMSEAVLRQVIGSRTVDQVLTVGRSEIEAEAKRLLQKQLTSYKSGLSIVALQLRNVTPPEPVQASFNDVNRSEQDREKVIDQARATYNREIPAAEGEALRTVEQAKGQAIDRVNRAKGDANRFLAILAEYRKSPEVTRRRLYLETMAQVLPAVGDLTILDGSTGTNVLPLLDLKRAGGAK
jgi:membrane protease subunit HflK